MKKKVLGFFVVLILVAFLFPIANIVLEPSPSQKLASAAQSDPDMKAAEAVLGKKCLICHGDSENLPFYAGFPVASGLIQKDIQEGRSSLNLVEAFSDPAKIESTEVALSKLESVLEQGTMPPGRYVALHWNHSLSPSEREALLSWLRKVRVAHFATGDAAAEFASSSLQPIPLSDGQDPEKVELGRQLFHDTRLSKDNTLSCASCHDLEKGGTDQKDFSVGIGGQVGGINSPTVYNSGLQFAMFWDGRAANLEEQAAGPVHNPIEMGSNWEEVLGKLNQDEAFVKAFNEVYAEGLCGDSIVDAIAAFERSLLTPYSEFDRYLRGEREALSAEERDGLDLFQKFSCNTCHVGQAMGGQSYEKMGYRRDYFETRGDVKEPDYGRFNVTQVEADRYKFKVPTLRNISATYPYFHDASTDDLVAAVEVMARAQSPRTMTRLEAEKVAAFLKALNGEYQGKRL